MDKYSLLPFRFKRLGNKVLITSDTGDYCFLSQDDFEKLINKTLSKTELYYDLKSKGFLYNQSLETILDIHATRYRSRHRFLFEKASLHIFVVTLNCNQKCSYCHVASEGDRSSSQSLIMDNATAKKCVEFALNSPSTHLKFEFQGGEPLLNFDAIKVIVDHTEKINESLGKQIEFVLCSNLIALKKEHIDFFKEKSICISTSLDGPEDIHDKCRKLNSGSGSYNILTNNIKWAKAELGSSSVSALITVTPFNINRLRDCVDEYLTSGFDYIFIRKLNQLGYAYNTDDLLYSSEDFIKAYFDVVDYIIKLNLEGQSFSEAYATILLSRILTPFSTNFVDLQSPTGSGLNGILYDHNGDVYISDEGRMLNRTTGNSFFCIGNVNQSRNEVFSNQSFKEIISKSILDITPGCAWCAYKPYCGSDPVRNLLENNDLVCHQPSSNFCKEHKPVFDHLFKYLESNETDIMNVFWSWITQRKIHQIQSLNSFV